MKRTAWTIAVVAVAIGTGLALSAKPWAELKEQRGKTADANADLQAAQTRHADLEKEAARLSNPAGREATAREHGFRKPGEVPVEEFK